MKALTFDVRLLQPLLVTQVGAGEENSSTAFGFIPGSVLRGDLVNRYLQGYQVTDVAQDPKCRRLFFDGDVRYLNAYPTNRLGQRTLPTPLSWRVNKDERDEHDAALYDLAVESQTNLDSSVPPAEMFCWRDGHQVEFLGLDRYIGVHNASDDRSRKRKGTSTVYRYEAIAVGARLSTAIVAEDEKDLGVLHSLLDGVETNLGGSRSAGYGRVHFENIQYDFDWHEYEPDDEPDENIVILTLLSDVILRDEDGQFTTNLDEVLNWKRQSAYLRTRIVGGFNRKWGLPLVQVQALQAGSVFVYPKDKIDMDALRRMEQQGIGERRVEGFGRFAVNWHTQAQLQGRIVRDTGATSTVALSGESQQLAKRMAERQLRSILEQRLMKAVSDLNMKKPLPSNAQLSRLRLAVKRAWREGRPQFILDHLKNLNKAAKDQFERVRINNERFLSWLNTGIQQNKIWDDWLQPTQFPPLAGVTVQPTDQIKMEYTARLLDALLKKATKESD
jgi:CRISPR-associated protein Csx10